MVISCVIMSLVWGIPMILYIIWKRGDWYLFLFPLFISILICAVLSWISDMVSIGFALIVAIYFIYNIISKSSKN